VPASKVVPGLRLPTGFPFDRVTPPPPPLLLSRLRVNHPTLQPFLSRWHHLSSSTICSTLLCVLSIQTYFRTQPRHPARDIFLLTLDTPLCSFHGAKSSTTKCYEKVRSPFPLPNPSLPTYASRKRIFGATRQPSKITHRCNKPSD
jgi:hypothetical protein